MKLIVPLIPGKLDEYIYMTFHAIMYSIPLQPHVYDCNVRSPDILSILKMN